MSSGQQQQQPPPPRRVTNVGSLLLTPQENESLFTFLGKKCVVSGRDPRRRHGRCYLAGPGSGSGEGGGSGAGSLRLLTGPSPPGPAPSRRAVRAAAAARGHSELTGSRGLSPPQACLWSSAWRGPLLPVQTLL